jgi:hypothetical protein
VLRSSLRWLGTAILLIILVLAVQTVVGSLPGVTEYDLYYSYAALPTAVFGLLAGFAFYKSARSLAPVNRFLAPSSTSESLPNIQAR